MFSWIALMKTPRSFNYTVSSLYSFPFLVESFLELSLSIFKNQNSMLQYCRYFISLNEEYQLKNSEIILFLEHLNFLHFVEIVLPLQLHNVVLRVDDCKTQKLRTRHHQEPARKSIFKSHLFLLFCAIEYPYIYLFTGFPFGRCS